MNVPIPKKCCQKTRIAMAANGNSIQTIPAGRRPRTRENVIELLSWLEARDRTLGPDHSSARVDIASLSVKEGLRDKSLHGETDRHRYRRGGSQQIRERGVDHRCRRNSAGGVSANTHTDEPSESYISRDRWR